MRPRRATTLWPTSWMAAIFAAFSLLAFGRATAGPPFMTDDPEPVEYGHWEVNAFSAGAHGSGDTSGLGPSLEINYGALPNLQLHVITGAAFDHPSGNPLRMGPSDTEIGAKYRFINPGPDDWWPQIGVFPLVETPTGNAARGLGAGYTQAFLPVWIQKDFGQWTTYGGGGYWINPGPGNRNYWFAGWVLQRHVADRLTLGGEIFHQTSAMVGRAGSWGFNLGGVYDLTDQYHLLFSAGQGGLLYAVDAAATRKPITYYVAFQRTF